MNKIDVIEIAQTIESAIIPESQQQIMDLIDSINGQTFTSGEIIEKVIGPLIGITNASNRKFTVALIQEVVNQLEERK